MNSNLYEENTISGGFLQNNTSSQSPSQPTKQVYNKIT